MKRSNFNRKNSNYYNDFLKCLIYINVMKNNEIEWKDNLSKLTLSDRVSLDKLSKLTLSDSAKATINERAKKLMNK